MLEFRPEVKEEWRRGWPTAIACLIGSGASASHALSLGLFIKPITESLGWSAGDVTLGIFIVSIIAIPGAPLGGWLAERFTPERVILYSLPFFLLSFAAVGALSYSHLEWLIAWAIVAIFTIPLKANVWMLLTAQNFDASRGAAFAIVMSGTGLFSIFLPILTQMFIDKLGWHQSFPALALTMAAMSIPVCYFAFRSRLLSRTSAQPGNTVKPRSRDSHLGMSLVQAMRLRHFWQLTVVGFLFTMGMYSMQVHLVPMFQAKLQNTSIVALIAGAFGIATLVGQFTVGALLDWVSGRLLGVLSMFLPAFACILYVTFPVGPQLALAIAILLGLGMGAEGDVLGYITTKYFGVRNFGTIYGVVAGMLALGAGFGPYAMALMRDHFGSYDLVIWVVCGALLLCAVLIATLGKYPDLAAGDQKTREPDDLNCAEMTASPARIS